MESIANELISKVQNPVIQNPVDPFPTIRRGYITLRPILFGLDRANQDKNQRRFINGKTLINYCWTCFRPENRRETCETEYRALNNWGEQFERLMGYFKNYDLKAPGTMEDVYNHFAIKDE